MPDQPDDSRAGYKKPPVKTRFKPGQSGNPKGRPKGRKTRALDLDEILYDKLNEEIATKNSKGEAVIMKKSEAFATQLVNGALKGDPRLTKILVDRLPNIERAHVRREDSQRRELKSTTAQEAAELYKRLVRQRDVNS